MINEREIIEKVAQELKLNKNQYVVLETRGRVKTENYVKMDMYTRVKGKYDSFTIVANEKDNCIKLLSFCAESDTYELAKAFAIDEQKTVSNNLGKECCENLEVVEESAFDNNDEGIEFSAVYAK